MAFTDEELERDWVPNGERPVSTMARNFQQELGKLFNLDDSKPISDSNSKLDERKENLGKDSEQLAELEARLHEMEQRLNRAGCSVSKKQEPADDGKANKSRPGTARATQQAPSAGNMPPTPGASEDGNGE